MLGVKTNIQSPPLVDGIVRSVHIHPGEISPTEKYIEYKKLLNNFKMVQADINNINGHNLDTIQKSIQRQLTDIGNQGFKGAQQSFFTSRETFPITFKPEGTMLGLSSHLASRKEDQGVDNKGQWAWV